MRLIRTRLLFSILCACAEPTPAAASASNQQPTASKPVDGDAGTTVPGAAPSPTPDTGFRAFGGPQCITDPKGKEQQFAALAGAVIPQLVGAAVDLVTSALDAAGKDHIVTKTTVVPLEAAVKCIQIVKGYQGLSSKFQTAGFTDSQRQSDLTTAKFLVEIYLRQSRDGSALLVTPTMLNYRETLEGKQADSKRDLYLTITFTDAIGGSAKTVSVPLGSFNPGTPTHYFDPVLGPSDLRMTSPLGAANSAWIANPSIGHWSPK